MIRPLSRLCLAAALGAVAIGTMTAEAGAQEVTTVLVVRHAEKAWEDGDPPLSAEGRERAEALLRVAEESGVSALYASQFRRTSETLEPIAVRHGIAIERHDAGDPEGLARLILSQHVGEVVLVAGHSNTVPLIVAALGAPEPPPIQDSEYDNLYVVSTGPDREATVLRLNFGRSSPVPTP